MSIEAGEPLGTLRRPACLRDERVRLLVTEARARRVVDLRKAHLLDPGWAERVRSADTVVS